jgi:glutamate racemase
MNKKFIAILDSGLGGISVLKELKTIMPNENYLYFGDNENLPYGNKSKRKLLEITFNNINKLLKYEIKALVLGCNTLSTNIYFDIAPLFDFPIYCVFPPVEKCLINGEKTLLLSTKRTAEKYKNFNKLRVKICNNLAKEIEENKFCLNEFNANFSGVNFKEYDSVILGCTHYFFIENKISDHQKPPRILRGELYTAMRVFCDLQSGYIAKNNSKNQVIFFNDKNCQYERFWKKYFGFLK